MERDIDDYVEKSVFNPGVAVTGKRYRIADGAGTIDSFEIGDIVIAIEDDTDPWCVHEDDYVANAKQSFYATRGIDYACYSLDTELEEVEDE